MIKFDLIKGHYIRKFDTRNYCIAHETTVQEGKNKGNINEHIDGYYASIPDAYRAFLTKAQFLADDNTELKELVNQIERIYDNIELEKST